MYNDDAIDGDYQYLGIEPPSIEHLPAVNTSIVREEGYTPPFNHAARLADKLYGAVEVAIDNLTFSERVTAAQNERTIQMVSVPSGFLPPQMATFIARNSSAITTMVIIGLIFWIGMALGRR